MTGITEHLRRLLIIPVIAVQVFAMPANVLAQEIPSGTDPTTSSTEVIAPVTETTPPPPAAVAAPAPAPSPPPPVAPETGPTKPTGADSNSYTLNPETGNWENGYYSWNPATNQTSPIQEQSYSYNPATGMWDTTQWVYSPESGKYQANRISTAQNPTTGESSIRSTGPGSTNTLNNPFGSSIGNTGPNSTNTVDNNSSANGTFDLFFNGNISNSISSNAQTGNSIVQGNTNAGNALTGDASVIANVLNMIQSSWFGQSSNLASFVANLDGNVFGDLSINPNNLGYGSAANTNLDINIANNSAIDNDINLIAGSGNATVEGNTNGGDATSGDAYALANILNMINSAIYADQSFIGMINIFGNLNGDIFLPEGMLDRALLANTGPNSSNTINGSQNTDIDVDLEKTRTINNTINAEAESGEALVANNTNAGSAATGDAETNVNTMNLVGEKVTGKNALLVFVNVLGSWIGFFLNPGGGGSAAIDTTGPNSTNAINNNRDTSVSVDATENSLINNNINVAAASGNANVTRNTNGGNATSGDASANVNILNMIDSQIDVSDWFGVLFINIFGDWLGSFGVDTEAGEVASSPPPTPVSSRNISNGAGETATSVARANTNQGRAGTYAIANTGGDTSDQGIAGAAASSPGGPSSPGAVVTSEGSNKQAASFLSKDILLFGSVAGLMVLLYLAFDNRQTLLMRMRALRT